MSYTVKKFKEVFAKKGYRFFENGNYNLNIIAVRNKERFTNLFDDEFYIIYKVWNDWHIFKLDQFTTIAGTLGRGGEQSPLTGRETGTGVDGVAVILEGQYLNAIKWISNGWIYPFTKYFKQIKPFKYYRDNNKNGIIDRKTIYEGNYSTHVHAMSSKGVLSRFVNYWFAAWSQGCMGSPEPEFVKIEPIVNQAIKIWGDVFTITVLNKKDFE